MSPAAWILALSLLANAALGWAWLSARDDATAAAVERDNARGAAMACSDATEDLRTLADKALADGRAAREKARQLAASAGARADAELSRAPAVRGDACASAQQENREWLEKRRAP